MDIGTLIGMLGGLGLIGLAMAQGAGGIKSFIDFPSFLVVVGGTAAGTFVMFPIGDILKSFFAGLKAFLYKVPSSQAVITTLVEFSTIARKDGILALENSKPLTPFMGKGVALLVDGIDAATIRYLLETEIRSIQERHANGATIFEQIGALAPAFGMIGTLIGLVQMLQSLSDPASIGPSMAIALITTLYGALIANLICIPMAKKLTIRSRAETSIMELITEGVISISKKENPNLMKNKLNAYLSPKQRVK